jgi:hypothetical protein
MSPPWRGNPWKRWIKLPLLLWINFTSFFLKGREPEKFSNPFCRFFAGWIEKVIGD